MPQQPITHPSPLLLKYSSSGNPLLPPPKSPSPPAAPPSSPPASPPPKWQKLPLWKRVLFILGGGAVILGGGAAVTCVSVPIYLAGHACVEACASRFCPSCSSSWFGSDSD